MKKLLLALTLISVSVACKKETTITNSNNNGTTTNTTNQQISSFGPNIKDIDGNTYKTVNIGTQQWMAENLKVSKYNDGTNIKNITDNTLWQRDTSGAWSYYNNDATNNTKYGKLYNWYAVSPTTNGGKNICPTGWHVPTDAEWTILIDHLGGEAVAGGKMKEVGTTNWNTPNTDATNTSLFSGLAGGNRGDDGIFGFEGSFGNYWISKDIYADFASYRYLKYNNGYAKKKEDYIEHSGLSVRCLKD